MSEAAVFWIFFWCGGWEVSCLFAGLIVMAGIDVIAYLRALQSQETGNATD